MIEHLSRWFAPGMRLMMQLRMPVKFALITLAFLAPLVITLLAVLSYASDGIDFTRKEQQGAAYLQLLNPVLGQASRTQGGANLTLDALQKHISAEGDQWGIKEALVTLQQSQEAETTSTLLEIYSRLADQSGLILDPDIDSYYVMSIAVLDSPQLALAQGELGRLHRASSAIESIESVTTDNTAGDTQADFLYGKVTELATRIKQSAERAAKGNASLARVFDDEWRSANESLTQAIRRHDSNLGSIASESVTQTLALNKQALDQLDTLLEQRIDRLQAKRNLYLFITLGCLLLAGYLVTSFYLSEIKGFWGLTKRMQRLADGNLVADFGAQGRDEIGQLIDAFESSRGQLHLLVEQIHSAAQTISSAGDEIASANLDLSKRSADQANMVGATASQIHTITEKVHANLEAAASANSISLEAFKAAEQGKKVMDQVVATMSSMKGSSTKIGAIIDVINAIAFQTNLLALNAAVEAARAGEQGRGFAVVAGEVRNLAQRCATAANEITQLIKASVDGVNTGVTQVDDAGKSMVEILDSVQTVSAIMGEMVDAGRAQTSSTQGIQAAVRRIEEDASQNAAMVEQTASAADLLRQQVDSLMAAISRFNVGSHSVAGSSHRPPQPLRHESASQTARAA